MSTAMVTRQDQQIAKIRQDLHDNRDKIMERIGSHIDFGACVSVMLTGFQKNPALAECTPPSIFRCFIEAAAYNWRIGGVMGEAYMVPFNNRQANCKEATLIPGYKGLRQLVERSGKVRVSLESVHEGDTYEYNGQFDLPTHKRSGESDRIFKPVTHVYCVGRFPDGMYIVGSLTAGECIAHRGRYSQNWKRSPKEDNPWHENNPAFRKMCMKTVLRMMVNEGAFPMSIEDRRVAARAEDGTVISSVIEGTVSPSEADPIHNDEHPDAAPKPPATTDEPTWIERTKIEYSECSTVGDCQKLHNGIADDDRNTDDQVAASLMLRDERIQEIRDSRSA